MQSIDRIRSLPLSTRKIILWTSVVVLSFSMIFFWFKSLQNKLEKFEKEKQEFEQSADFPVIEMPAFNWPEVSEEMLTEPEQLDQSMIEDQEN
jgi:hypothetical protein